MNGSDFEPRTGNIFKFLKKGYSFREIILKGATLKVWAKMISFIKYDFYYRGRKVDIDHRSIIDGSRYISLGDRVWVQRGAWLVVPLHEMMVVEKRPYVKIEEGTRIGPNCTISGANKVYIGKNVLFGPNVMVVDHTHRYNDVTKSVLYQGILAKGEIIIEDNAWVGSNVVIYSARKRIVIGRNSVIAANTVVRNSVEACSMVSGNPAVTIKKFNLEMQEWIDVIPKCCSR